MTDVSSSRVKGRAALAVGLVLVAIGGYALSFGYEQLGENTFCANFHFQGIEIDCAGFDYGRLVVGWAFFAVGVLLSIVGAYHLGLSAGSPASEQRRVVTAQQ